MKLFIFYENDFPDLSFAQVYPGVRCWTRCWSYPIPRFAVRPVLRDWYSSPELRAFLALFCFHESGFLGRLRAPEGGTRLAIVITVVIVTKY